MCKREMVETDKSMVKETKAFSLSKFYPLGLSALAPQDFNLNTDGWFTAADLNTFESPGNSSDSSRKQIFRDILGKFSYLHVA